MNDQYMNTAWYFHCTVKQMDMARSCYISSLKYSAKCLQQGSPAVGTWHCISFNGKLRLATKGNSCCYNFQVNLLIFPDMLAQHLYCIYEYQQQMNIF